MSTSKERSDLIADLAARDYEPAVELVLCMKGLTALSDDSLALVAGVLDLVERHRYPTGEVEQ